MAESVKRRIVGLTKKVALAATLNRGCGQRMEGASVPRTALGQPGEAAVIQSLDGFLGKQCAFRKRGELEKCALAGIL